jgi:hypothetical protein
MSSALAIASVTALLKNLLDDGMVDDTVVGTVGNVKVSAVAPDLIALTGDAASQLNLFLYQVSPNPGWRNAGLPSRDARGERLSNQPLALDLHYLLTAYASRELHAEILLGYGMQILHEAPGLSRDAIRRGLGDPGLDVDPQSILPADLRALATSELAEQFETIKVTGQPVATDEMSKLWTALQSKYRPSTAYSVSVVLIEAKRSTRLALPVQAPKIYVDTFRAPRITSVGAQETAGGPVLLGTPILVRHRLVLRGIQLRGERTLVRVGAETVVPQATELQDTQIAVQLPDDLAAGLQSAQVIHERLMGEPPAPHTGSVSNLAAFILRPEILGVTLQPSPESLRVSVEPPVRSRQRALLYLNELQLVTSPNAAPPREYSFVVPEQPGGSPSTSTTELDVPIQAVVPGTYLVRLQVDGADSPVFRNANGQYDRPAVTIP